jgi:hypothetical protein
MNNQIVSYYAQGNLRIIVSLLPLVRISALRAATQEPSGIPSGKNAAIDELRERGHSETALISPAADKSGRRSQSPLTFLATRIPATHPIFPSEFLVSFLSRESCS